VGKQKPDRRLALPRTAGVSERAPEPTAADEEEKSAWTGSTRAHSREGRQPRRRASTTSVSRSLGTRERVAAELGVQTRRPRTNCKAPNSYRRDAPNRRSYVKWYPQPASAFTRKRYCVLKPRRVSLCMERGYPVSWPRRSTRSTRRGWSPRSTCPVNYPLDQAAG
jgi:hypothetical protein